MCGTRDSASNHTANKFYRANFAILSTANFHYFSNLKLNQQDSAVWSILKEATYTISNLNINALKEERVKLSNEFVVKECATFQTCVEDITENNGTHFE